MQLATKLKILDMFSVQIDALKYCNTPAPACRRFKAIWETVGGRPQKRLQMRNSQLLADLLERKWKSWFVRASSTHLFIRIKSVFSELSKRKLFDFFLRVTISFLKIAKSIGKDTSYSPKLGLRFLFCDICDAIQHFCRPCLIDVCGHWSYKFISPGWFSNNLFSPTLGLRSNLLLIWLIYWLSARLPRNVWHRNLRWNRIWTRSRNVHQTRTRS